MAQLTFDSTQYNPEQGAGQLSVGRHLVIIEGDEIKKAKESQGGYLEFKLKGIQASESERGAYRLNLFNAGPNSQVTIEAANRQLSAVCHAVGVQGLNGDTSVLWNLPFIVEVGYQRGHNPATDGEDAKGYTQVNRVLYADGGEIKPGQYGSSQGQQQNQGGFGQQGQQQQQTGQQGQQQFGQQNQNQNQQQVDPNQGQQQQNGGQQQFGQQPNQVGNQQQNNGGQQWQPGQGNNAGGNGTTWQPRT